MSLNWLRPRRGHRYKLSLAMAPGHLVRRTAKDIIVINIAYYLIKKAKKHTLVETATIPTRIQAPKKQKKLLSIQ